MGGNPDGAAPSEDGSSCCSQPSGLGLSADTQCTHISTILPVVMEAGRDHAQRRGARRRLEARRVGWRGPDAGSCAAAHAGLPAGGGAPAGRPRRPPRPAPPLLLRGQAPPLPPAPHHSACSPSSSETPAPLNVACWSVLLTAPTWAGEPAPRQFDKTSN